MIEQEIVIHSAGITLSGTLCLPDAEGCFPVVFMVHGSGCLDRDENAKGFQLNVFNTFAHHLSEAGIASLRYDKRGCGRSAGDYHTAGHHDLVDDAIACYDALTRHESCIKNQVYVLGHSEGTVIAPQMTLKRPAIAGIILLNPFVQKLEPILIQQARHIADAINGQGGIKGLLLRLAAKLVGDPVRIQRRLIQKLKTTDKPTIRRGFNKLPVKWFREAMALDPETIFGSVTTPMLVVGGEKDLQCDPADVARIAALAKGPVETHVIKDLTHILRLDPQPPSILNYRKLLKMPIAPEVLNRVTEWLSSRNAG